MPNGKPHFDGHLSVGARRVIGDIKRTLNMSADTIQLVIVHVTIGRTMMGKWCRRTRIRIFVSSLSYDSS